ncbi:MAG: S41 family peptidase [Nitrospirota bacterium]|nr:S41 family peptidase [Nitrospirota bacterium]
MPKGFKGKVMIVLVVVFLSAVGSFVGRVTAEKTLVEGEAYEHLKVFAEVLSLIQRNYVEDTKTKDLTYSAIKGMLGNLDPHSSFMTPEVYKEMQVDTKGEFGGLGIQIGMKDNLLTVISPIEETPAEKAGIKAGDKILKIDGETTKDMTLSDAVGKMRGQKGTPVTLTIGREAVSEPFDVKIVRDIIKIKSVKSKVLEDKIGYVRLTQFQEQTAIDMEKALQKLDEEKIEALILDMRNNPGGLLNVAVDVCDKFLKQGDLVVYIKGRDQAKDEFFAKNGTPHPAYPIVVLVNEGSASASEIVAGALQDWGRGLVVGTQTFGKGSVQTVIPLSDGSGLRLTTAKYYTPKGRSIQNTGIAPDIVVKVPVTETVAKAEGVSPHKTLREKDLKRHLPNDTVKEEDDSSEQPSTSKPSKGKEKEGDDTTAEKKPEDDIQLQKAIDLIKTWKVFKNTAPLERKG